jgi:peptide chain release factor 1
MFALRRQSWLAFRLVRHASVARQAAAQQTNSNGSATSSALDLIRQLETDSARVLRIVRKRVDERTKLLDELSEGTMSSSDIKKARQAKELEPLHSAWDEWESTKSLILETYPLLSDPDPTMRSLASEEYPLLTNTLSRLKETFPVLLAPPSTTRHLSAIMDFKSGAGGQESSLFLAELVRMYTRYAGTSVHDDEGNVIKKKWKVEIVAKNDADAGGMKDAIVEVKGEGAYDAFRWESGVHRVQRVPATESGGRLHTSTVALIVLPLPEETDKPESDELFNMDDVKIEVMRARGAGGQVNRALLFSSPPEYSHPMLTARQQNRICG